jgi:glucokinase
MIQGMILAGDIGGTHARMAIFAVERGRLSLCAEHVYPTREYRRLEDAVRDFIDRNPVSLDAACFGIAGPVRHGRAAMPNLGWVVDSAGLAGEIGIQRISVINDLEANAYGIAALDENDFAVLNPGAPDASGNAAVISAGTGLGEAGLYFDGSVHRPFACEGGHADFAPANELQTEMLSWLRREHAHVSWERVLSGPGIVNIYSFLRDTGRGDEPAWLAEALRKGDPAAVITTYALEGKSALCGATLDMMVSLYGAEAANLALKVMATGGVFIGGGIAPKILKKLQDSGFMRAFANKGRMSDLLRAMPVKVILNEGTALLGAARAAALSAKLL